MRYRPAGRMLASSGVTRASSSKSANVSATPSRRAIAIRWMIAFVEPPRASTQTTALRKAARVQMSDSVTSSGMRWAIRAKLAFSTPGRSRCRPR